MESTKIAVEKKESVKPVKRTANVREVDNGYIIRLNIDNSGPLDCATSERRMEQELIVTSLPSLFKKLKVFFEPEIVEE